MRTYRIEQSVGLGKVRFVGIVQAESAAEALKAFVLPEKFVLSGRHPLIAIQETGVTASLSQKRKERRV